MRIPVAMSTSREREIKEDCTGEDHSGETEDEDPLRGEDPRDENIQVQLMSVLHKGV